MGFVLKVTSVGGEVSVLGGSHPSVALENPGKRNKVISPLPRTQCETWKVS